VSYVAPLGLALSPALASADARGLMHLAGSVAGGAQVLEQQAGAVTACLAGARWEGFGAVAYHGAAAEQARRIRVTSALLQELTSVVSALAGALASARGQALDAVSRGRQLDLQADELNRRARLHSALLPQDPDGLLAPEQEAEDLRSRMQLTAIALRDAERAALEAWARARGEADAIAYATPVMRQRMLEQPWDPAASVRLDAGRAAAAISCGPMDELALPPGGVLTGPDGRSYDLVVQTARDRDGHLLVTSEEQPETRAGWHELALRYGTTQYGRKATTWEKVAVAVGGAAGMSYPQGSTFAPDLLGRLRVLPGGGAYVPETSPAPEHPVREVPAAAPSGKEPPRYWTAPSSGLVAGKRAAVPDAVGLVDGGLSGYLVAKHLDDGRAAAYRVVFEENAAGERRARMQLYRVLSVPGGSPRTLAAGGYVDFKGKLAGAPVTGEDPDRRPIMREAGS
jgi:hypothetical protein